MIIGHGEHAFEWIENWAVIPETVRGREDGRTHGVAVTRDSRVIIFHVSDPAILIFRSDGVLIDAWGDRFPGAHGLTLVEERGREFLWLTDFKTGEVVKTTLDGTTVLALPRPDVPGYDDPKYAPTWVSVFEERFGGNGDIWVADGYGAGYVHRYDRSGRYVASIDGTRGAGRFRHPHGLYIDTRKSEPELYIADRMNRRIQVFDVEGRFKRVMTEVVETSACALIPHGQYTLVPEAPYRARLTILDPDERVAAVLGEHDDICTRAGFPNDRTLSEPGRFTAPHSAASDSAGCIYVVEWITGGRITKLVPVR